MDNKINQLQVSGIHVNDMDAFIGTAIMNIVIDAVRYYEGILELEGNYITFSLPFVMKKNQYVISFYEVFKMVEVIGRHISVDDTCTVIASSVTEDQMLVNHCFVIRHSEIHHFTETFGMYGFKLKNLNLQKNLGLLANNVKYC